VEGSWAAVTGVENIEKWLVGYIRYDSLPPGSTVGGKARVLILALASYALQDFAMRHTVLRCSASPLLL